MGKGDALLADAIVGIILSANQFCRHCRVSHHTRLVFGLLGARRRSVRPRVRLTGRHAQNFCLPLRFTTDGRVGQVRRAHKTVGCGLKGGWRQAASE